MNNTETVVIKGKTSNKVLIDEAEYKKVLALAKQFEHEDPEGIYRPEFVKEMVERASKRDIVANVNLKDLLFYK